ncbi:phage tail protein [Pseudomonas poae]|uniref:Phage-related protein, tail component n=1 Tax=Pseudomonas poae TaxID=200451 RepID=A0ABY0RFE2_9PSED|nr:phage tail protein [Pseudomonas poae]KRP52208.1 host specificity protein J [Pseudomonas poae]SDN95650.1 Phage-related protein, tail component [Pseudomonas poae]
MTDLTLAGSKGGASKPRPSVEAPDSLQSTAYARILDLVSEGEIVGLKNDKRSVFLDETPLANADGSLNFSGVTLDTRNGSQDQSHIPGFPAVENESPVSVELRSDQPWTKSYSNLQLSAVRVRLAVTRLSQTNTSNGDTNGYTVQYAIDLSTDGGAFTEVLAAAFSGKTTTKYERSHRVDLPPAKVGWTLRVRRITPNSTSGTIADTTTVESSTEVIDAKLRYPGSALIGLQFDAAQFQSIPSRSFELRGRIIKVPNNYDPQTRTYSGVWDGTFKSAWTDNPAWIYYDLLLHQRYGLGHLLNAGQVDKWELYRIGQYCDQPVSDGKGGTEPRFTCNLYLSVRADALKVLQDLATTFRGMAYWGAGSVMAVADMPEDPVYTYSNANVIGGQFIYGGSAKKTRYTVALVSWNDPADFYRQKVQYVDDAEGIARYGIQQTEISATGCTSQAQAQRIGKWALLTNRLETESVTFSVGLDGTLARPGQVIRVADNDRAGRRIGGRLRAATLDSLTLDAEVTATAGDTITLVMPNGKAVSRKVKSVSAAGTDGQLVVLQTKLDELPPAQSIWAIDSATLALQQFRVLSISEDFSDDEIKYSLSAVKHVPSKFAAIDDGAKIDSPPITVIPPSVQAAPTGVTVSNDHFVEQGSAVNVMTIEWQRAANAIAYEAYWRKNDGEWVYAGRTGGSSIEVSGIYAGRYVAKVRAINALDIGSLYSESVETVLNGKTTLPPTVAALTTESLVFAIKVKWQIPQGVSTADLQRTEIWYGKTADLAMATKLGDYAYPQTDLTMMGLAAGTSLFFWARLVDRTGNIGPWFPSGSGVNGQASSDASPILDLIAGQISETQLGKHLLDRIELIDGSGSGSVNDRLDNTRKELQALVDQVTDALLYDAARTYASGEFVRQENHLYQAIQAVPANSPPANAAYWLDIGSLVQTSNALALQIQQNKTAIETVDGKVTSTAQKTDGVYAQVNPKMAGDEQTSFAGDDVSMAGTWSVMSAIAEGDIAQAMKTDALEVRVNQNRASITNVDSASASRDEALAQRVTRLDARVSQNKASITNVDSASASRDEAIAQRVTQLDAKVNNNSASIDTRLTTLATADKTLAQSIETVQTKVNQQSVSIQTNASAIADTNGKLAANWSVRMQVAAGGGYKFAGIGLGIENGPGGVQSQFLISADQFAIYNENTPGKPSTPFAVRGAETFINSAFIQNGTITNAKIGSTIQSDALGVNGKPVWILDKSGLFELNSSGPGGRREVRPNVDKIYDAEGNLRIKIGDLNS